MIEIKNYDGETLLTVAANTLQGANLRGANLRGAYLEGANLRGANLEDANLEGVDLSYANLRGASFENANLRYANLRYADLRDANLRYANLRDVALRGAINIIPLPVATSSGRRPVAVRSNDAWAIYAGCRGPLSIAEARKHWLSPDYNGCNEYADTWKLALDWLEARPVPTDK